MKTNHNHNKCYHLFTCHFFGGKKIPGPWIVTNIAGKRKEVGETVNLKIRSPNSTVVTINLLQRGTNFNKTIARGVKLNPGRNVVPVVIPGGVFATPSPQNYFAVFLNGLRVDYSATFQIGCPGWGITVHRPTVGTVLRIRDTLHARWHGSFVPPNQDPSNFTLVRGLLEPALVGPDGSSIPYISFNFINGINLTFTSHYLDFKLPPTIPPNTLYKFGFLALSSVPTYKMQIYSAGTFLIIDGKNSEHTYK